MGYKHSYDITKPYQEIRAAGHECSNPRTDGYLAWGIKQDLYKLKWFLDETIKKCPTFSVEPEWLKDQEQEKIIKYLSNEL